MEIQIFTAFHDNYIYLIPDEKRTAVVVDPAESNQVLACLKHNHLKLDSILVTHSHMDHTGGVGDLKRQTGCRVIGPESTHIQGLDMQIKDEQVLDLFYPVHVLFTPGHTIDSVCYYFRPPMSKAGVVFTGDTLFVNGCGRLGIRNAQTMWSSLSKLAELPSDTRVYCGHEYAEENYRFALIIEPDNQQIQQRLDYIREQIRQGKPTVPSTIGLENQMNPFLRADSDSIRQALSMPQAPAWQVFAELRKRKDRF